MKTLTEFLDDARAVTGSDYATAKALNVKRQNITNWKKSGVMDRDLVPMLAELLEVSPAEIHAACDIARMPEARVIWEKWAAAGAAVSVILALAAGLQVFDFYQDSAVFSSAGLYIMRIYPAVVIAGLTVLAGWFMVAIMRARSYTATD